MKTAQIIGVIILLSQHICAQTNLINNPSLEVYLNCPNALSQISNAKYWFQPLPQSTSDYYHACSNLYNMTNRFKPRTGSGIAGIITVSSEWREYLEISLKEHLSYGKIYYFRFFIRPASCTSIDKIGAFFSADTIKGNNPARLAWKPQIENLNGCLTDTSIWAEIGGEFISQGNEAFITIGCFAEDDSITYCHLEGFPVEYSTYYLFDDFCLYEKDAPVYSADAGNNVQLCFGDSIQIGNSEFTDYLYKWIGTDSSYYFTGKPWVKPKVTTTYYLFQKDFKFDETIDSITIDVIHCKRLTVPNIFTPNYDGINDFLQIINPDNILYDINIYNRWGVLIFQGNQDNDWDGCYGNSKRDIFGNKVDSGVYYYIIQTSSSDGAEEKYKGVIHLLK